MKSGQIEKMLFPKTNIGSENSTLIMIVRRFRLINTTLVCLTIRHYSGKYYFTGAQKKIIGSNVKFRVITKTSGNVSVYITKINIQYQSIRIDYVLSWDLIFKT